MSTHSRRGPRSTAAATPSESPTAEGRAVGTTSSLSVFGELVTELRKSARLTQRELARRASIDASHINRIEKGIRRPPKKDNVLAIARALGLDRNQESALLEAAGYSPRSPADASVEIALSDSGIRETGFPLVGVIPSQLSEALVIQDPVHGHTTLTRLERDVVDTPAFQRLRSIRNLGLAHLEYPSALHTRFEHSLGVLHVMQEMLDAINRNPATDRPVTAEARIVARLSALLGHIGEPPLGMVLVPLLYERRTHQGRPSSRARELAVDGEIRRILGPELSQTVVSVLDEPADRSRYPFVTDLVSSGLDAHRLDDLQRGAYFMGLPNLLDSRLVDALALPDMRPGPSRATWSLGHEGLLRLDVVDALLGVLRARMSMMERLYFRATNAAVMAMMRRAFEASEIAPSDLTSLTDEEVLVTLANGASALTRWLIACLRERRLYKTVYTFGGLAAEVYGADRALETLLVTRVDLEDRLAKMAGVDPGRVLVYRSPTQLGTPGELEARVLLPTGRVTTLGEMGEPYAREEAMHALSAARGRRQFYVFLDRSELADPVALRLGAACQSVFGVPNQLEVQSTSNSAASTSLRRHQREPERSRRTGN